MKIKNNTDLTPPLTGGKIQSAREIRGATPYAEIENEPVVWRRNIAEPDRAPARRVRLPADLPFRPGKEGASLGTRPPRPPFRRYGAPGDGGLLLRVMHPIGYVAMILILSGVAVLQLGSRQGSAKVHALRPTTSRPPEPARQTD